MSEVFGKKPVTSSEFPVLLMDAMGTLLHFNPPVEKFYFHQLSALGHSRTEDQITRAMMKLTQAFNETSEQNEDFELKDSVWIREFLQALQFDEADIKHLEPALNEAFSTHMKVVLPETTIELLEALKERGYRLAVISNSTGPLADVLRIQGVLGFFEMVMTSLDAGYAKPHPQIFQLTLEDIDVSPKAAVYIGSSYAADVVGARRAGLHSVLYDPTLRELRALSPEDTSGKIVSLESLRHNRRLDGVKAISKLEELLEFFL